MTDHAPEAMILTRGGRVWLFRELPKDLPPLDGNRVLCWASNLFGGFDEIELVCGKGWRVIVTCEIETGLYEIVHDSRRFRRPETQDDPSTESPPRRGKCSRS